MTTEMNNARVLTPYQQKYIAWQLNRRRSSSDDDKFTGVLSEAKVDLKTQLKTDKNKLVAKLYNLTEAKVETVDKYSIK